MNVVRTYYGNTEVQKIYKNGECVWTRPDFVFIMAKCDASQGDVNGTGFYELGSDVTLTAVPKSGYRFDKWLDGNTQSERIVTARNDKVFTALFTFNVSGTLYYDENY